MAHFSHTNFVKKAYHESRTPNLNSYKPVKYRPTTLDVNIDDPESSEESHPITRAVRCVSFLVLLVLCVSTLTDLNSARIKRTVQEMAASLRDDTKHQMLNSPYEKSTKSTESFKLSGFYALDDRGLPMELSSVLYPVGGPVIALLTTNTTKDVSDSQTAIKSLAFLHGDLDSNTKAPILIFHENNLSDEQKLLFIRNSPSRPISFPTVNFHEYPDGLDLSKKGIGKKFIVQGRDHVWGYHQMIRFWITRIWEHPALDPFGVVMRMDSDSCFKEINEYLPGLKNEDIVYHSEYVGVEDGSDFVADLMDHAERFLERYDKSPGNPMLWRYAKLTWEVHQTIPLFMTNFEVVRKSWMQKNIVKRWHESLTEENPFGVFTRRWGDAVTRFLMIAMLTMNYQVDTSHPTGYFHKENCAKDDVEQALKVYESFMNDNQY